jgi:hypothetical protein
MCCVRLQISSERVTAFTGRPRCMTCDSLDSVIRASLVILDFLFLLSHSPKNFQCYNGCSALFSLNMHAGGSSETFLLIYQTTWRHTPENCNLNIYILYNDQTVRYNKTGQLWSVPECTVSTRSLCTSCADDGIRVPYTGRFIRLLTGSRLCSSWQPMHRRLRGAYEFCRWINMPFGR